MFLVQLGGGNTIKELESGRLGQENGEVEPTWQMEGVSKGPWALTRHIMHWEEAYKLEWAPIRMGPQSPKYTECPSYSKL